MGGDNTSTGVDSALTRGELAMLGSWSMKAGEAACPEGCEGISGDETKLAAAGERRQTATLLQSRRPEGAPPDEVPLLAFSSLRCSTGDEGSILTLSLKI